MVGAEMLGAITRSMPVFVVIAVSQHVDVPLFVSGYQPQRRLAGAQGRPGHPLADVRVGVFQNRSQSLVGQRLLALGGHAERVDHESHLARPVMTHGASVIVGRAFQNDHRLEVRRVETGQRALVAAAIRAAHGPDPAVAPVPRREPFERVEPVWPLVGERVPRPLRSVPAANVLHRHCVAPPGEVLAVGVVYERGLVVGSPLKDQRKPPLDALAAAGGKIEVRRQAGPVSQGNHDVAPYLDPVLLPRALRTGHRGVSFAVGRRRSALNELCITAASRPVRAREP